MTGATRGIGRAVVDLLAGEELYLTAARPGPLEELCAALPSATGRAADLRHPEALAAALDGWLPDRLDGIVHNAGVSRHATIADESVEGWQDTLTVNVVAVAELTRLCLPATQESSP